MKNQHAHQPRKEATKQEQERVVTARPEQEQKRRERRGWAWSLSYDGWEGPESVPDCSSVWACSCSKTKEAGQPERRLAAYPGPVSGELVLVLELELTRAFRIRTSREYKRVRSAASKVRSK